MNAMFTQRRIEASSPVYGGAVQLPRVAVYTHDYLIMRMTFIYRQLAQLEDWQPILLATGLPRSLCVSPSSRTPPSDLGRMMARNHHCLFKKHSHGSRGEYVALWWSCLGFAVWSFGRGDRRVARSYARQLW
jgi:hypothetical protein